MIRGLILSLTLWTAGQAALAAEPARPAAPSPCHAETFEGSAFTVCRYDPATDELRLVLRSASGPLGSLPELKRALGADAKRVAFAMNAGMYEADQSPVGLYVEAGRELTPLNRASGSGNFHLTPNGVFWTDRAGAPHVDETSAYAASGARPAFATQSGPLLVSHGALHPKIAPNGTSLLIRNGVGVKGGEAVFVISDEPVSFGRFARFFRDGLGCPDALYLDGTVSSLWAPNLGRRDGRTGLGPLVVVLRRPRP